MINFTCDFMKGQGYNLCKELFLDIKMIENLIWQKLINSKIYCLHFATPTSLR